MIWTCVTRPSFSHVRGGSGHETTQYQSTCKHHCVIMCFLYGLLKNPVYTVTLSTQLSSLCHQMDRIWEEAAGGVVLYDWQQFLTNDTLDHLFGTGLKCELPLEFEDPTSPQPHWDERALQVCVQEQCIVC